METETAHRASSAKFVPVDAFDLIVFGACGDLALRKLIPALFHRWQDGQIPAESKIIGSSRSAMNSREYRALALKKIREYRPNETITDDAWASFAERLHYVPVQSTDPTADWEPLCQIVGVDEARQRIFYLALPPTIYGDVCRNLAAAGLKTPGTRVVLEKPIGRDLASAQAINQAVGAVFDEESIFRIDHYLGKETVQNLIVLRFMNSLLEPVWNANTIDHIQITVAESIGAGLRAGYYDTAGALRDMVQNHLLQLLCLVAMEPPLDLGSDTVRDEKIKVLRALRPMTPKHIRETSVRGFYESGAVAGEAVRAYEDELGQESTTETFVALKAYVDNWRWKGVPFYMRTGKRMKDRRSEIVVQFKDVAHTLSRGIRAKLHPSRLIIRLQPDEGMSLMLMTKDPGPGGMRLRYVPLNLSYADTFAKDYPDAYERLLMAVVRGDLSLFMRRDEVTHAWQWVDAILGAWHEDETPVHPYPAGTDGPAHAAMLLGHAGREWFTVPKNG